MTRHRFSLLSQVRWSHHSAFHIPVLRKECVDHLMGGDSKRGTTEKRGLYVDCTLGGGGHTAEILRRGGKVIGIDQDLDSIEKVSKDLSSDIEGGNLELVHANFSNLFEILQHSALSSLFGQKADGVLFDLGVSSHQLDRPDRGFSYRFDGELDMRMNYSPRNSSENYRPTALDIVNDSSSEELECILFEYGEEKLSSIIAREIVHSRPIHSTLQLKEVISSVTPGRFEIKTLSRCFQALRIAVNDEISSLEIALEATSDVLVPGGRLVVLSYHSLEDRMVKNLINRKNRGPNVANDQLPFSSLFKKPIVPSRKETKENSRSKSAKLRVGIRL